jgi:hypothetical protein
MHLSLLDGAECSLGERNYDVDAMRLFLLGDTPASARLERYGPAYRQADIVVCIRQEIAALDELVEVPKYACSRSITGR